MRKISFIFSSILRVKHAECLLGEPYIRSGDNNISSKSGLGLGTFIGKTLLERMKANVTFDRCPKHNGAMVTIQWQTKSLLFI